jgi:hypothetical protein
VVGGAEWSATVSESSLRGMQMYVDGRSSSGFESDRLNQPTDFPAAGGEASIGGTPGAGAMVYGFLTAEADGVVVRSGDGTAVRLPIVRGPLGLESYFAIPVPEGVELGVVEFVDASNEVVATLELPYLPRDLSGAYGGFATILPV